MNKKNRLFTSVALMFSIYFPPEPGGGASAAWNRALILNKIGYSVFIVCGFPCYPAGKIMDPKYKGKIFCIENMGAMTLIRLRLVPLAYAGYLRRLVIFSNFVFATIIYLPKILRITGRVNLVYSIAPPIFASFSGLVYSRISRSFFVYEVSDLWPEEFVAFPTRLLPIIMIIGRAFAKLSYKLPDLILAIGELAAEHITKEYKPKVRVSVFPIGVDTTTFRELSKDDARAEIASIGLVPGALQHQFIALYSGLISRGTAVENIAYAAKELKEDHEGSKEITFLIVGDGEGKYVLEELKVKYNLTNLLLLPFQPRNLMPAIISSSDVCIVPLPSENAFDVDVPTKFYEYLACGKPIIGICEGELARIIDSNNIGRTVKVGDTEKLVSILKHFKDSPGSLHDMEDSIANTLEKFTLDSLTIKLRCLLEREV